ncbi:SMC-Scp complex subunit ScpB [Patescibacteria group bacterium]|nr:SMC-Scp complex subunit ScpB [Patescibacteria group bacterium]
MDNLPPHLNNSKNENSCEHNDSRCGGLLAKIEAILFVHGEPISLDRLTKILNIEKTELVLATDKLLTELNKQESGLTLIKNNNQIQLITKPELSNVLEDIIKQEFTEDLSTAALETISIIAYAGPISRADIEYIRGVNSSFTIRNLLLRGLVERSVDPKRTNAYIYNISFNLIKKLGIVKIEDLPDYKKYKQIIIDLHASQSTNFNLENNQNAQ